MKIKTFAIASVLLLLRLLLAFLPALSGISGNSKQKNILQTIEQLIQFSLFVPIKRKPFGSILFQNKWR